MHLRRLILFFLLLPCVASRASAQAPAPDSSTYSKPAADVIDYFTAHIAGQSELYNGAAYMMMPPPGTGSYYFGDKNYCTPGTIRFNGTWYKNLPILYDVYHDRMITYMDNDLFVLDSLKISDVYLLDHHFCYMNQPGLVPGFYDVLYKGKSQVVVKWIKAINEEIVSQRAVQTNVRDKSQLYLKKGNSYFPVTGKSSFATIFSEKKKEIKQFIHDQKIDYGKDKEAAAVAVAGYYDQLNK